MKRTLIIAALFLGFSAFGFSQTTESTAVVLQKESVSSGNENSASRYTVKDLNTGFNYKTVPTQAQLAIGEHAPFLVTKKGNGNSNGNGNGNDSQTLLPKDKLGRVISISAK